MAAVAPRSAFMLASPLSLAFELKRNGLELALGVTVFRPPSASFRAPGQVVRATAREEVRHGRVEVMQRGDAQRGSVLAACRACCPAGRVPARAALPPLLVASGAPEQQGIQNSARTKRSAAWAVGRAGRASRGVRSLPLCAPLTVCSAATGPWTLRRDFRSYTTHRTRSAQV